MDHLAHMTFYCKLKFLASHMKIKCDFEYGDGDSNDEMF